MATSRIQVRPTLSPMISERPGIVFTLRSARSQISTRRRTTLPGASGIVMSTCWRALLGAELGESIGGPEDGDSVDDRADAERIVVDESDRADSEIRATGDLAGDE